MSDAQYSEIVEMRDRELAELVDENVRLEAENASLTRLAEVRGQRINQLERELTGMESACTDHGAQHRQWVDEARAERDRLAAENAVLRGTDSDERDGLITDPILRRLHEVRAERDRLAAENASLNAAYSDATDTSIRLAGLIGKAKDSMRHLADAQQSWIDAGRHEQAISREVIRDRALAIVADLASVDADAVLAERDAAKWDEGWMDRARRDPLNRAFPNRKPADAPGFLNPYRTRKETGRG